MSALSSASIDVPAYANLPITIPFNSPEGRKKFQEATLKHAMFNNPRYYKMTQTPFTNRDAQIAMIFCFNALQFTIYLYMANFPPVQVNNLVNSLATYAPLTKPILMRRYEDLVELENVRKYFEGKPLTSVGLTMLDMRNLIVNAKPFMAVRHYASQTVVHHGPVDYDNVTMNSTQTMINLLSDKWEYVGFLAFVEISDIWPRFGQGHMVAAVAQI